MFGDHCRTRWPPNGPSTNERAVWSTTFPTTSPSFASGSDLRKSLRVSSTSDSAQADPLALRPLQKAPPGHLRRTIPAFAWMRSRRHPPAGCRTCRQIDRHGRGEDRPVPWSVPTDTNGRNRARNRTSKSVGTSRRGARSGFRPSSSTGPPGRPPCTPAASGG